MIFMLITWNWTWSWSWWWWWSSLHRW